MIKIDSNRVNEKEVSEALVFEASVIAASDVHLCYQTCSFDLSRSCSSVVHSCDGAVGSEI
jgi:hypothetical protein